MKRKVLKLKIKRKYLTAILEGRKEYETREVRPSNIKKLLELDDEGYEVLDDEGNSIPVKYDCIQFISKENDEGINDSVMVEVKDAHTEVFFYTLKYPDGTEMLFEADEEGNAIYYKTNEEGEFILDEEGNRIKTDPDAEDACPYLLRDAVEGEGVTIEEPIEYEYKGENWTAQQVVYRLGKIIDSKVTPKSKI